MKAFWEKGKTQGGGLEREGEGAEREGGGYKGENKGEAVQRQRGRVEQSRRWGGRGHSGVREGSAAESARGNFHWGLSPPLPLFHPADEDKRRKMGNRHAGIGKKEGGREERRGRERKSEKEWKVHIIGAKGSKG